MQVVHEGDYFPICVFFTLILTTSLKERAYQPLDSLFREFKTPEGPTKFGFMLA